MLGLLGKGILGSVLGTATGIGVVGASGALIEMGIDRLTGNKPINKAELKRALGNEFKSAVRVARGRGMRSF